MCKVEHADWSKMAFFIEPYLISTTTTIFEGDLVGLYVFIIYIVYIVYLWFRYTQFWLLDSNDSCFVGRFVGWYSQLFEFWIIQRCSESHSQMVVIKGCICRTVNMITVVFFFWEFDEKHFVFCAIYNWWWFSEILLN